METKIILDTTFLVDFLRNKEETLEKIRRLFSKHELCTTDINIFELYYGAYKSKQASKNIAAVKGLINALTVFNTDEESMELAGKLLSELEKKGKTIEMKDILIAGICLIRACPIVTDNKEHFSRMGVKTL